jgi:hypothetical protein
MHIDWAEFRQTSDRDLEVAHANSVTHCKKLKQDPQK